MPLVPNRPTNLCESCGEVTGTALFSILNTDTSSTLPSLSE
jgi:hypothetical protein